MKKRILAAALLCTVLAAVSCGDAEKPGESTGTESQTEKTTETEAVTEADPRETVSDMGAKDFGGYEFRVIEYELANHIQYYDFSWSKDNAGELINDAVMDRNLLIEDLYNCKITAANNADTAAVMKKSVSAGQDDYDFAEIYINTAFAQTADGGYWNFYEIPYISMDKPWWDQAIQRDIAIFGKLYAMTGDISIYDEELNFAVYFNKAVAQKHDITDLYTMAKNGTWTMEKMISLGRTVSEDVDGSGDRDENDSFGVLTDAGMIWLFYYTSGNTLTKLDDDGLPYFTTEDDRTVTVTDKLAEYLNDPSVLWAGKCSNSWTTLDKVFMEDRALFRPGSIYDIIYYRGMNTDFGILPYPKFDEQQDAYYHLISTDRCPAVLVPTTNTDIDRTGFLLEALARVSSATVTPAYYDVNLYSKLARDDASGKMLDIIFSTKRYDLGYVYDWGGGRFTLADVTTSNKSFAAIWAAKKPSAEKEMKKIIDALSAEE